MATSGGAGYELCFTCGAAQSVRLVQTRAALALASDRANIGVMTLTARETSRNSRAASLVIGIFGRLSRVCGY